MGCDHDAVSARGISFFSREHDRLQVSTAVNNICPANELLRVTALHDCRVLDTSPEESFDELTRLLAQVCGAPIAIISFIDSHRQWNKSHLGLEIKELPRNQSICAHTILKDDGLFIEDCAQDDRFASTPLVRGRHGIRFYAGVPIRTAEGLAVGSVAVMDTKPRSLSDATKATMHTIARQASMQLALRRALHDLQRKQSQTEFVLRETETSYHSLVESLPQNIFRKDTDGRFTFANSKFCSTINRQKSEIIGKTDSDLFPPDLAAKYRADDLDVIVNRKVVDTVERHQTPEGLIYVHVMKTPLFDASGQVIGIQGIFWDETERHQAHEQISKARDAALESARLKSQFLANMSHEIRTPMNAVIGMTGLLLDTNLTSEQRDFADTIRASADSLLTIINDILDFSKIEAGKLAVEFVEFELNDVIERATDLVVEAAHHKGIRLAAQIHDAVPRRLFGDPGRLRQVLTNLLGNAVKFTEKGEVILEVKPAAGPADQPKIHFAVRDTGIGIPREAQTRIFQAFTQADGSVTRRYGGTGLGLAITKQLVELMQGKIGFSSEPGKGTTFWFELPLGLGKTAIKHPSTHTGSSTTTFRAKTEDAIIPASTPAAKDARAKVRILLAEDNAVNQKVALRQLSKLGYQVDAVNNGLEAVKAMERQHYPVILMDCQMPELDGYKATQRIREMQSSSFFRWPHKPYIIAMTANALAGDREACLACGMDDYISKPVRIEQLASALQRGIDSMENASKPESANNQPLLDNEALDNLRTLRMEGEPDPLAELVTLFINDTPTRIAQIEAALKNSIAHDLEAAAHSLKGSASNLGARTIAATCARIIQHARSNEFGPATNLLKSLESEFTKVKAALLQELSR